MSSTLSEQCKGWTYLCRAITIAAWESGNPVISNGSVHSNQRDTNKRVYQCGMFHRGPHALSMDSTDIIAYWCSSLVNDRRNNRENGKNLPKRIKTVDQRGCSCKFQFTLKWVIGVCFYIKLRQKSGCLFFPQFTSQVHWTSNCTYPNTPPNIGPDWQHSSGC